ncbi:MAG: phage holin family protein [Ruminococcaceae bacterium]|nr:phage holin family protein [Oscillospiraceae bacterium]
MDKILNKINSLWGLAIALLSSLLGRFWYLFAAFMLLNIVDYVTGIIKAKVFLIENSGKGLLGIIKKVGYWIVIALAFFISLSFENMGKTIGINLSFTRFLGWFTLATFIINETRSILENLVALGVDIPPFLTYGLEVASNVISKKEGESNK